MDIGAGIGYDRALVQGREDSGLHHQCYSRRYRTAAVLVRQYRQHLMALEDYYTERSQINDSSAGTTAKDK